MSDRSDPQCDGLCVTAADLGVLSNAIAYPHPGCPLHDPNNVCRGKPDGCSNCAPGGSYA